jgi:hypothetical protein
MGKASKRSHVRQLTSSDLLLPFLVGAKFEFEPLRIVTS